jgi:outer membrane lipoprotein-sorting protein
MSGGTSMSAKVWMKGTKMRMDVITGGVSMQMYIDSAANVVYIYDPTSKTLMKSSWTGNNESAAQQAGDILGYHPTTIGPATIDGYLCTVIQYTYTDSSGTVNAKAWIWNDNGLPLRIEVTDKAGTSVIEMKNIILGSVQDGDVTPPAGASTFVVPTGLPGMPTGYPGT